MPKYQITAKGGQVYEVEANDDTQAAKMEQFINERVAVGDVDLKGAPLPDNFQLRQGEAPVPPSPKAETGSTPWYQMLGFDVDPTAPGEAPKGNIMSTLMQGLTLGSMDEIAGGFGAVGNAIVSPFSSSVDFDPVGAYQRVRDEERATVDQTRKEHPWLSTGSELIGGLLTANPTAAGPRSFLGATKASAKTGAVGGAAYGFNSGDGFNNSVVGGAIGGAAGGVVGGVLPTIAQAVSRPVRGAINYLRPDNGLGGQLVARSLMQDGISPRAAGTALDEARGRGVPLSLADLGENTRGLAGAVSRAPGRSRTIARESVVSRQAEQGERLQGAIERDLGPTGYVPQLSDDLRMQARAAAAPLYDQAYAVPGRSSPALEELLATPAGRSALGRARTIAANERRDPNKMGFDLDANGETVIVGVPSTQTLDYVKRGLDDMIEGHRDPITRRLHLDEAGRAVNDVRANFIGEMDRLNPVYREARAAYQEPARAAQSLEAGEKALNASADDIQRATAGMTDADRAQFALGHRSALSAMLDGRVDGGNKAAILSNSPKKRDALVEAYGNAGNVTRFGQTLDDENAAYQTYHTITGGSPTANRLADDAAVQDGSLLQDVTGSVLKGFANGGIPGGLVELIGKGKDIGKFGAGKTGERARESAASLLFQQDPAIIADALRNARQIELQQRLARLAANQRTANIGGVIGRGLGGVAAYGSRPVE